MSHGCAVAPVTAEEEDPGPLVFSDQTLPDAWVGLTYQHALTGQGGLEPITWNVDSGRLPDDLRLRSDGRITGVPTQPGTYSVMVEATEADGVKKFAELTLQVHYEPVTLGCGETYEGTFDGPNGGVDWARFDSYRWVNIRLPSLDTTRISLNVRADGSTLGYLSEPGEPSGSHDLEDGYERYTLVSPEDTMRVDLGTSPSLTAFRNSGRPIPFLMVSNGAYEWSLEVECSEGPIFGSLWRIPVELGEPIEIDYDVLSDPEGVRIWTDDPLPDWVTLYEDGRLEGTAEEVGGWDFMIQAEDAEGRTREEEAFFGVFDVTPVHCDEEIAVVTEEGFYEGTFDNVYDPRGYEVYSIAFDESFSQVDLTLSGAGDTYLGLVPPDPYYRFYGYAEYDYGQSATLPVGVTSYPRWSNYREDGEALFVAARLEDGDGIGATSAPVLQILCDDSPKTDLFGLPVLPPNENTLYPLTGIGGTPPYSWSGTGLPAGVSLGASIRSLPLDEGEWPVSLTIEDAEGRTSSRDFTLFVGEDTACEGIEPLPCDGEMISGTFDRAYYTENPFTDASTQVYCLVPREERSVYAELEHRRDAEGYLLMADPGVTSNGFLYEGKRAMITFGDEEQIVQLGIAESGWPGLPDYQDLPLFIALQSYEPGNWVFSSSCY